MNQQREEREDYVRHAGEGLLSELDALGIRFDAITTRGLRGDPLDGYKAVIAPAVGGSADPLSGLELVTTVDGIKPGIGS